MKQDYFKDAALEYITKSVELIDSVDIVNHFKLQADIILAKVQQLIEEGKIERKYDAGINKSFYQITEEEDKKSISI